MSESSSFFGAPFPQAIEIQTVSVCNSRCRICPMEWTADQLPQGRMSDTMLESILSECREHRDEIVSLEPYLNNEPFLDKRMVDILRSIRRDFSCNIEISTNASLLTAEISRRIVEEHLIDDFRFSVFGASAETYEKVMVGLSWDAVKKNLDDYVSLWDANGRRVRSRIVFVENPKLFDESELERVRRLWEPTGLGLIVWGHLDRAGNNRIQLNQEELAARSGNVISCKPGYMRDRIAIQYNGDVLLCCQDWGRELLIGNLREQTLQEVWDSGARRQYYSLIYDPVHTDPNLLCLHCELATFL